MKVHVLLGHADNYGRDVLGIYSTRKKAEKAALAVALDDGQQYDLHHIVEVKVDTDSRIEWQGPS